MIDEATERFEAALLEQVDAVARSAGRGDSDPLEALDDAVMQGVYEEAFRSVALDFAERVFNAIEEEA